MKHEDLNLNEQGTEVLLFGNLFSTAYSGFGLRVVHRYPANSSVSICVPCGKAAPTSVVQIKNCTLRRETAVLPKGMLNKAKQSLVGS